MSYVITIARSYGSGGKTIGQMLSKELGINYYDRDLIKLASEDSGINVGLFGSVDEKIKKPLIFKKKNVYEHKIISPNDGDFVSDDNLFNYQAKVIKQLHEKESCIIVGRCADYVLGEKPNVLRIFVHANEQTCIKNVIDLFALSKKDAIKKIARTNKQRSAYYRYYTGHEWDNAKNYDLCIDTSALGFEKSVELIKEYMKIRDVKY